MASQNQPAKKTKRLGQPVQWSEKQLSAMAQVSESDRQAANVLWNENAPAAFKGLLQAEVVEVGNE